MTNHNNAHLPDRGRLENEGGDGGGVHGTTPEVRGEGGDGNNGETTTRFTDPP